MKMKSLLIGSTVALGLGLVLFTTVLGDRIVSDYSMRPAEMPGDYLSSVEYMKLLRGNIETGEFEPNDFLSVAAAVEAHDRNNTGTRAVNLSWTEMGPDNVGGRSRAILAVTNNLLFAGSVTGGLFKSTNAGNNWTRVESLDAIGKTMAISCIDQTLDGTIYIGTGAIFESGGGDGSSGSIGVGLYRSTDLGATWQAVPGTVPSPFNNNANWAYINDICADPNVAGRIWIAGNVANNSGLAYWEPGMSAPSTSFTGFTASAGHDIEWAKDGSYMLVSAANGRIYKSENGGSSFSQASTTQMVGNRIRVAISPDNVNVVYALYTNASGNHGGLYYSSNKAGTWSNILPAGNDATYNIYGTGQGFYDLALIVKPGSPGTCWLGAVTLWKSGPNTTTEQIAYNFDFGASQYFVHSDIHSFEIAPNGDWYIATDGGIFKSTDGGSTFTACNRGFNVTQFYGIAHSGGNAVMGGAQDNGTQVILGLNNGVVPVVTDQQAVQIQGGDGFYCDMTQTTVGSPLVFATLYYGVVNRYDQSGNGGSFYDNDILNLTNPNATLGLGIGIFYTPVRLYENTEDALSQQFIRAVNPKNKNITDTTITLLTNNLNIPFDYNIPAGDTMRFWPQLIRPAFSSSTLFTTDPNYFWLPAQSYTTSQQCDTLYTTVETQVPYYDSTFITIEWVDSSFVAQINQWIYHYATTQVLVDVDTLYNTVITTTGTPVNCSTLYNYRRDTLANVKEQRLIQDRYTSLFVTGFTGNQGIWFTRQALNLNVTPDWWRIGNAPNSGVRYFEFSPDGKTLWYSGWGGGLWRVTGFENVWNAQQAASNLTVTQVLSTTSLITSIAVDPTNMNRVVITFGGYGSVAGGKVRVSTNALSANPTFTNIWSFSGSEQAMNNMPIFSSIINVEDPNVIVVGTEFGVYATDNNGTTWTHCDNVASGSIGSLAYVPVFELRQQKVSNRRFMNTSNYGVIYAGTHGRGIFRSADFFNSVEEVDPTTAAKTALNIYPNPTINEAYIELNLSQPADRVTLGIYNVRGQLVNTITRGYTPRGSHKISLETEQLPAGNYIVTMQAGETMGTGKFIKLD